MNITPHLVQQADMKGISLASIQEVLANPHYTYASNQHTCRRHGVKQEKWVGQASNGTKLCIAVAPCCQTAITVFLDQVRTELRPDQKKGK